MNTLLCLFAPHRRELWYSRRATAPQPTKKTVMSDARPEGEAQEYMQRRARKPVSYAELDAPGHMRMGDQIVAALEAAGAIVPSSASDSSTSASASKEPRGFDLIELTDAVSKRMGRVALRASSSQPFGNSSLGCWPLAKCADVSLQHLARCMATQRVRFAC